MSRPFHWFQGKSVEELVRRLLAAGVDARLEVHQDGKDMTFRVIPPGGEVTTEEGGGQPINDSHVCPPSCP